MRRLVDKYNRTISCLRVAVTDRCNLRCDYCMPAEGIGPKSHSAILSYEEIIGICKTAASWGINKIRLTGGEPLVRRDLSSLVAELAVIPGIAEVALTTNGIYLEKLAPELKQAGLHRVNVSLDSLQPARYAQITRGGNLDQALRGIAKALAVGLLPVKINIVWQPGINDDEYEDFLEFARQWGVMLQFIHAMSLRHGKPELAAENICSRPPDCRSCNRLRLTADGKIKPCLLSDLEIDVRQLGAEEALLTAVAQKPEAGQSCYKREMVQIGG